MTLQTMLVGAGFDREAAEKLAGNEYLRQRYANKSSEEILERINLIAVIYDTDTDSVRSAFTKFPRFAAFDHERVINGIVNVYGWNKEEAGKVVFRHPPFAGLDHERVINEIANVYGHTKEEAGKVVFKHPPFAGYKHERVIKGVVDAYGCTEEEAGRIVFKRPQFAGLNHERVINGIANVYGWAKEEIGRVVFKFPPFAGLDHERVMRQLSRIGRIVGLDEDTVKEKILKNPKVAGYSAKRYLAAIDVIIHLRTEGQLGDRGVVDLCLSYVATSPYVPDTDRLRITQALKREDYKEDPPLIVALRKSIRKKEAKDNGKIRQYA